MVTVSVAKYIADLYDKDGIYDKLIRLNHYPFLDPRQEFLSSRFTTVQTMTPADLLHVIDASKDNSVADIHSFLSKSLVKGFPIVDSVENMVLVGYIGRAELKYALDNIPDSTNCVFSNEIPLRGGFDLSPWTDQTPFTVHPQFPIEMVNEVFRKMGFRICFVTFDGKLLGLITKKDLIERSENYY